MTTLPSHAALVEEVAEFIGEKVGADCNSRDIANGIFEFLAARLSEVTPEMVEAWGFTPIVDGGCPTKAQCAEHDWRAMLAASPLAVEEEYRDLGNQALAIAAAIRARGEEKGK